MEQHAPECKDLLLSELCELRKRVASQIPHIQLSTPALSSSSHAHATIAEGMVHQSGQAGRPLFMTPPSTELPSSDHEVNTQDPFGPSIFCEDDDMHRQRSSSILNLDSENLQTDLPMDGVSQSFIDDEEMEEGEVASFEESTLMVEAVIDHDEEEDANDDPSAEDDVLRVVGVKSELGDEIGIANTAKPSHKHLSGSTVLEPPPIQGAAIPSFNKSASKISAPVISAQRERNGKPSSEGKVHLSSPKSKMQSRDQAVAAKPRPAQPNLSQKRNQNPNSNARKAIVPSTVPSPNRKLITGATESSSTVLGYGYEADNGTIVPMPPGRRDPHGPPKDSSRLNQTPFIQTTQQSAPEFGAFGPIRTNMHHRNDAISYGRGPHPYANNSRYPRLVPPMPPGLNGPNEPFYAPPWYPYNHPAPNGMHPDQRPYPFHNQYTGRGGQGEPTRYQGLPPNLPPRPPWLGQPPRGGMPEHLNAHVNGFPSQLQPDFDWEGFEGKFSYIIIYNIGF